MANCSCRRGASLINNQVSSDKKVSILFGREDRGLTNEELQLANTHIEIPANPEYPVLNLAMSSQIICYEIFKSHFNQEARDWHDYPEVDSENLQMLIDHFIETAVNIDVIIQTILKRLSQESKECSADFILMKWKLVL
jgi:tRNA (cytidine32/uridine32-2'-O)-methyltransferase